MNLQENIEFLALRDVFSVPVQLLKWLPDREIVDTNLQDVDPSAPY